MPKTEGFQKNTKVSGICGGYHEKLTEVRDIVQETGIKTTPKGKKCKKAKWLSEEALQTAVKRREAKSKGEKEVMLKFSKPGFSNT